MKNFNSRLLCFKLFIPDFLFSFWFSLFSNFVLSLTILAEQICIYRSNYFSWLQMSFNFHGCVTCFFPEYFMNPSLFTCFFPFVPIKRKINFGNTEILAYSLSLNRFIWNVVVGSSWHFHDHMFFFWVLVWILLFILEIV